VGLEPKYHKKKKKKKKKIVRRVLLKNNADGYLIGKQEGSRGRKIIILDPGSNITRTDAEIVEGTHCRSHRSEATC
jgi:hypothetical protein